jgi:hypothetical protein
MVRDEVANGCHGGFKPPDADCVKAAECDFLKYRPSPQNPAPYPAFRERSQDAWDRDRFEADCGRGPYGAVGGSERCHV